MPEASENRSFNWLNFGIVIAGIGVVLAALALIGSIIFYMFFVDFVDNFQLGYKFDSRNGQTSVLERTGYWVTPPFVVKVHHVDLRPMQVCINANQRVLNCKLVQFNKDGLELFLSWHGRDDYDAPSSGSNSSGGATTTFSEILKSYAYDGSGKSYPFLTVVRELKPEESSPAGQ